ncbi:MAG: putative acetyltransferase [Rhodobacteraceae bacterium HLUCCA12]|nr:MAG: putative acetyltransferase [Rhodobacteraceae bacterium HLUCCA12]
MSTITLRLAGPDDAVALNTALRALSRDLGDPHRATDTRMAAALAPGGPCRAILAQQGDRLIGAALFSPLFSTARGSAGAYVSDLWIDAELRGGGLGQTLLAAVRDVAARDWRADFLRLSVYASNPRARAFYDRLGFAPATDEHTLTLDGAALAALKGEP